MVKFDPEDEVLHITLKSLLQELHANLSVTSETYVAIEVIVRSLLVSLDEIIPTCKVALLGYSQSGKSSLLNAMAMNNIIPSNVRTLSVIPISAAPGSSTTLTDKIHISTLSDIDIEPLIKLPTGKAISKGFVNCREHLSTEEDIWIKEFQDRELHVNLPLFDQSSSPQFHAAKVKYIDSSEDICIYLPQQSKEEMQVKQPNILAADYIWNCVDARIVAKLIDVLLPDLSLQYVPLKECDTPRALTNDSLSDNINSDKEEALEVRDKLFFHFLSNSDNSSISLGAKERALSITTFYLTHIDKVIVQTDPLNFQHKAKERLYEGFSILFQQATGLKVNRDNICLFCAPIAFCTMKILSSNALSIQDIYDYCEAVMGLGFMQTIDSIEENTLRQMTRRFAKDVYSRCGAKEVMDAMRLVDYNSVKHWLKGIALNGLECVDQLAETVTTSRPVLASHLHQSQQELTALLKELDWTVNVAQEIRSYCIKELVEIISEFANELIDNFLRDRLDELKCVLEHQGLEWYKERHICTIKDMMSALKELEEFSNRYIVHRGYLETKTLINSTKSQEGIEDDYLQSSMYSKQFDLKHSDQLGVSKDFHDAADPHIGISTDMEVALLQPKIAVSLADPSIVPLDSTNSFLDDNIDNFLDALEQEKENYLLTLFTQFCHHLKDEYVEFTPELMSRLQEKKDESVNKLKNMIEDPIREAALRLPFQFDIASELEILDKIDLFERDTCRLKNFFREMPSHVAAAAVEISNQWYDPVDSVFIKGVNTRLPLGASAIHQGKSLVHNHLQCGASGNTTDNISVGGGYLCSTSESGVETVTSASMNASPVIGKGGRTSSDRRELFTRNPIPLSQGKGHQHTIHPQLQYVYESWRLAFKTVNLHQLSQYNIQDFNIAASTLCNNIIDYISLYGEVLEEGIMTLKTSIHELQEGERSLVTEKSSRDLGVRFANLITQLEDSMLKEI